MIKNVSKEELKQINGTIFEVGKSLGSSVRRIKEKKLCEIS